MIATPFLYLVVCLQVGLQNVQPLQVSSRLQSSILQTSSAAFSKRSINFCLKQAKNNDETESDSPTPDEERNLNWSAIAEFVFDESIDPPDLVNQKQSQADDDTPHHHSKPIILFDGVCNLCNGGVNFAIDYDRSGKFRFASLQSNVAKSLLIRDGKDPSTTSDIVLFTSKKAYYSSEAVAKIMAGLDAPVLKMLGIFGQITPSFARNAVYRVVSGNRFILGESDSCRMDFDGEYTSRFVSDPPESITFGSRPEDNEEN